MKYLSQHKIDKRVATVILCLLTMIFIAVTLVVMLKLRFNLYSDSMPRGIYREIDALPQRSFIAGTFLTDQIANFGLERRYLIHGRGLKRIQPVAKYIAGLPGDRVAIAGTQLFINGTLHPEYPVFTQDSMGRPLPRHPHTDYTIPEDRYLLLSDHRPNSWDGRYWGPVPINFILRPLLIFGDL